MEVAVMRRRSVRASVVLRAAAAGLALPAVAGLAAPASAQGFGGFGPHGFGPHHFGPGMWVVGGIFLLLRALLLIGLVVLLWRVLRARALWQRPDSATRLLRERYARGEIGEDEYRKRLGTLA
jgi:uncharacterized membrane protein